ncbi:MAG: beta-propeller fold lactonase family protein, partial [Candidatus Cybelea sp.]
MLLAGLLAGCANTTPGSQALPLSPSSAIQRFARHRGGPAGAVEFAYVTNFGSKNVSAYAIDATTGALTPLAGKPVGAGTEPWVVVIDPTGKFAYVTNFGSKNVSAYTIDATSGALKKVKGSPYAAGTNPVV